MELAESCAEGLRNGAEHGILCLQFDAKIACRTTATQHLVDTGTNSDVQEVPNPNCGKMRERSLARRGTPVIPTPL